MRRGIPIQLTPGQTLAILLAVGALIAVLVAVALFEIALARGAAFAVRLSGRRRPRKSPMGVALDELEERLRRRSE